MKSRPNAIVTGGARGIGKAISKRLIEDGYFVTIADIDGSMAESLLQDFGSENVALHVCNITNESDVEALFHSHLKRLGKLNVIVNNAAIIRDRMVHKMTVDEFDDVIEVNLKGSWLMCRASARIMREQKFGRIINISSRGWLGNFGQTNYAASKAGLIGMTRVLALELGKYNVFVNAIAPGLIDTPLVEGLSADARESLINAQPTKCMGLPEDVAHVVSFLANERTKFITGQTLYVDGGKSIGAGI